MSMIDTITDFGSDVVTKAKQRFSYGNHPSIIMWSAGVASEKKDSDGIFGGAATALEDVLSSSPPERFNTFKFDAMVEEAHSAETIVTKFPVSSGFVVSDHAINQNRRLKLTAVAVNMQNSAMWMLSAQGVSVISGAIFSNPIIPIIGGLAGGVASAFETENRIQSTYDLFNNLRTTATKLYISTILGPYLNCVITRVTAKHDRFTSAMLAVEIELEELQVIKADQDTEDARKALESAYDYSEFAKIAQSLGVGVLGGMPLPGLGAVGDAPSKQLKNLQEKIDKLSSPFTNIKGRIV